MNYNAKWLESLFYSYVKTDFHDNFFRITIPSFFSKENGDLTVSVYRIDGKYHIHDNGCASKKLKENGVDIESLQNKPWGDDGIFYCYCPQIHHFLKYFHRLILIANANLYQDSMDEIFRHCDLESPPENRIDNLDKNEILNFIKSGLKFYDENQNITLSVKTVYTGISSLNIAHLFEIKDGKIIISDKRKGEYEGEIFEALYWYNDDISAVEGFIKSLCEKFETEFDGRDIYLTTTPENVINGFFRFVNAAVICSELRRSIFAD